MASYILRRWRSVSFRSGLVAALVVGVVATLAMFALLFLVFALFVVTGGLEQVSVIDRAQDQILLGVEPPDLTLPDPSEITGAGPPGTGEAAFWAVLQDGQVVQSAGQINPELFDAEFADPGFGIDFESSDRGPLNSDDTFASEDTLGLKRVGGREWLFIQRDVVAPGGQTYSVVSAYDGDFSLAGFIRGSLLGTVPVVVALAGVAMFVTSFLTRRALRRVERMRAEVELITQQSLDRRVPTADAADDIDKLGHTMNDMLERLQASSAQQNQFLADASHELRSPVAGLLAQLEVAAAYPNKVDTATLLPKLKGEAERLQHLVNDLLFLSRSEVDGMARGPMRETADIDQLLAAEVGYQTMLNPDMPVEVVADSGAIARAGVRDVERAVRNLVNNAVRHGISRVTLSSEVAWPNVVVTVTDDGPGVPADQASRIFDRFVRLDEARSRDAGGAGLGLAIAKEIANKHGGTLELDTNSKGPGAAFRLTLPVA